MTLLAPSLPRVSAGEEFHQDPLTFLAEARSRLGDMVVLREQEPLFSRTPDCAGVVAVFGAHYHRTVLSDIDAFGMPISAAHALSLPQHLVNLNCGVHSMREQQHNLHRHLLLQALNENHLTNQQASIQDGVATFLKGWQTGHTINLLSEMRQLALHVSSRMLFGDQFADCKQLGLLIQSYFQLRREASSPFSTSRPAFRETLIQLGTTLDGALRAYIRWCKDNPAAADGILAQLINADAQDLLSEDELVAHSNVLCVSSIEPIAVSLTWIMLILSQLPELRRALREELGQSVHAQEVFSSSHIAQLPLLDSIIHESMRLLPPNALMVRLTTRPVRLGNVTLPDCCELLLCPFLAHRDPDRFPQPDQFLPERWHTLKPSPFEYFPFGAGSHSCVGRHVALYLLKSALAGLTRQYELVLTEDQAIDWRIHIQFMPSNEPLMTIREASGSTSQGGGALRGTVSHLLKFESSDKRVLRRRGPVG